MEVTFHRNFKKKFKKLPLKIQQQFYERLELFLHDKFNKILNNHAVGSVFPNCRSINISGDYRTIFYSQGNAIIFITIGTHSDLYS
ncbi:MAG: type II toxin-antitoxin system mRNA interferase toxin, RelE/StbE family [Patescibacteria group bacterium]